MAVQPDATGTDASVTPYRLWLAQLRSIIFYGWLALLTFVWFIPSFVIGIFLPLKARNYFIMVFYCHIVVWSARLICGVKWRVEGRENIPADGRGYVLLSKHQSTWETFFIPTLIAPHVQVVKRELLYLPFFGWALKMIHPIFIDRTHKTNALKQVLTQGADRLNNGIHVLVFPEGTRVSPGKRKAFSKGGAMLATKSQAPVIAIAHNSGEHWPNDNWVKRPGTINLVISPVMETTDLSTAQLSELSESWINNRVDEISARPFDGEMVDADSSGKRF
ncbi:lysophospholipid acyltransferase family protein [Thalassolituus hydrocarboniclasticus]|uniref:1-acyl-sn-glycerol-3-phosphate acyltransferase n=1 Tax=Thalassolituus hydrocarboniclasticus TaxID=2742796 RepID=A0ABY6A3T7_9GAMM|nr:lysophospholipid acyltransferase family protein [Thalassolituus hydrocarboniclasticus]UXD85936.1 1-acyl-sn-glycerol-3-phosphate acyltransferase [Thalassolituus hydrocarboniclasticus]